MRRITLAAAVFAGASAAIAQTPATPPAPAANPVPVAVQDPVTIVVPRAALQAIGQGLMKLPYETAAPILNELQAQLNKADQAAVEDAKKLEEQQKAAKAPAAAPEPPKPAPAPAAK